MAMNSTTARKGSSFVTVLTVGSDLPVYKDALVNGDLTDTLISGPQSVFELKQDIVLSDHPAGMACSCSHPPLTALSVTPTLISSTLMATAGGLRSNFFLDLRLCLPS